LLKSTDYVLTGSSSSDVDSASNTYTQLGVYTITGIAVNALGNTTIQYVVVVQVPVTASSFVVTSTAPVVYPPGQYALHQLHQNV
jgi:hypothetical protein